MAQVGFFTKKQVGAEPESKKPGECKPRQPKAEPVHELPPPLVVKVPPAADKKKATQPAPGGKPQAEMDIECYVNYFLVKFRFADGSTAAFELVDSVPVELDRRGIRRILDDHEIVTYNGQNFDGPLLNYALAKADCTNADLKAAADELIKSETRPWKFEEKHGLRPLAADLVDLAQLCPPMTSLKLMGARLHSPRLQDLPYEESAVLDNAQMDAVADYCGNDLDVTAALRQEFAEDVELRRDLGGRYGVDLRSRSDAQIAEDIFKSEVQRRSGRELRKPKELHSKEFYYQVPDFVSFANPELKKVLDILAAEKFVAKPVNSGIKMPTALEDLKITVGGSVYRMGIGGLHSSEKSAFHLATADVELWDFDVTGYYPRLILNCGLCPPAVGRLFPEIYKDVVDERLAAKRAGQKTKAEGLKITVNGTFGKLGSPWSTLYAPELMIQTTVTGQLAILMLIDRLESNGLPVVSANTDGIVVKCPADKVDRMKAVVRRWEAATGFEMESTQYAGLWSRDVNNYVAIGVDGKAKVKGTFAYAGRKKNPEYDVCTDALVAWLRDGKPVDETIRECRDVRKFLQVRRVDGGAVWGGKYLGRVVRWYHSTSEAGFIAYKRNGNKVPQTDGARPVMDLPAELPDDIDYGWYINKCSGMFY